MMDSAVPDSTLAPAHARRGAALLLLPLVLLALPLDLNRSTELQRPDSQVMLHIDPNSATRTELMLLPRVGPALSGRIIAYREAAADSRPFACPQDLAHVTGIGPKTVAALAPLLHFPGAATIAEEGDVP